MNLPLSEQILSVFTGDACPLGKDFVAIYMTRPLEIDFVGIYMTLALSGQILVSFMGIYILIICIASCNCIGGT